MTFPVELCILFGISILFSSAGLYRFTLFRSVGYGLSVAACCGILLLLFRENPDGMIRTICGIIIFYGLTVTACLLPADLKMSVRKRAEGDDLQDPYEDMGLKIMVWIGCGALYALMVSPVCYRLVNGGGVDNFVYTGLGLMILGALTKYGADMGGARQRKKYPGEVCRRGLYRFVRCPGCFGEILFWTGVLLVGVTSFKTTGQWIMSALGYLGLLYAQFSGARRIEMRQNMLYGDDPRYIRYAKRVPVIVPLLPLHTLRKWRFLVF